MSILAIDPGSEKSAWVLFEGWLPKRFGIEENELVVCDVLPRFKRAGRVLAIESMHAMGMPQSQDVLDTQFWAGRFAQAWGESFLKILRREVKLHMCANSRAKDANIRQAVIDRFPPTGDGKTGQIGTKKQPGPLYGVSKDVWSALAIAITCLETKLSVSASQSSQRNTG